MSYPYSADIGLAGTPEDDPQGYLQSVWSEFVALGPAILDLQHRAAMIAADANAAGDPERAEQAVEVIQQLHTVGQLHQRAMDRALQVGEWIGLGGYGPQLGAIPVAALTILSGLALVVAWVFRAYEAADRKLDLIEDGILTPEQAAALDPGPAPGGMLGEAKGLLILAAVLGLGLMLANRYVRNPPLVVYGSNPPGPIGEDVHAIYYRHAEDGKHYVHEFAGDVQMDALEDGSVLLSGPLPLWEDFD